MNSILIALLVTLVPGLANEGRDANAIHLGDVLVLPRSGTRGRIPVPRDPVRTAMARGQWTAPQAGDAVPTLPGEPQTWRSAKANPEGALQEPDLGGAYVWWPVDVDSERIMILEASSHRMVYVNSHPRYGDPYGTNFMRLPVVLRKGRNEFVFHCRGGLTARLVAPVTALEINARDATLPDLIRDQRGPYDAAIVVLNSTSTEAGGMVMRSTIGTGAPHLSKLPPIAPHSARKVQFKLACDTVTSTDTLPLKLEILDPGKTAPICTSALEVRIRAPDVPHKRTFVSAVDGSVQYYAVVPARPRSANDPQPALVLSTHGAGVEATSQAAAYKPKTWTHIVAPTNRRPFGFDWEDWGRIDALETLANAGKLFTHDPQRVYLTGHSMGGHGAWHLAATFPDRFAAVGPSAGWMSFWSYASATYADDTTTIGRLLNRATTPSRTRELSRNLLHHGVYILHGDKDDNVPVTQARAMRDHLASFHHDLHYHEEPGAGHWWGKPGISGAACVDWPAMFDLFSRRRIPRGAEISHLEFTTANPGISARCHWATILGQARALAPSSIKLSLDPPTGRITGTTDNVTRMAIDVAALKTADKLTFAMDGHEFEVAWPASESTVWLRRTPDGWTSTTAPPAGHKGPARNGPFKDAFRNRFIMVYGTRGTEEENRWASAKAHFDAETFLYRGNASVDVMRDVQFMERPLAGRNVILYGNADTNAAWTTVLHEDDVAVGRGMLRIGQRVLKGDDLGCLIIRPRKGSHRAAVGIVGGTGLTGMRITDRLPYFVSGIAYPDLTVFNSTALSSGLGGIVATGFFGDDWSVARGEFAFRAADAP